MNKPKKILFVDLGDVLIKFEDKFIRDIIKEEKFKNFLSMIYEHDRGNPDFELFSLHQKLIFTDYFKRPVTWGEMVAAYSNFISGVHEPMYDALLDLKKRGITLVCLTDNNHFCFYISSLKFPRVCELFNNNGRDHWMLSYKFHSLKRDLGLFTRLPAEFGYDLCDAAFVDDRLINVETAIKAGFKKNSCFVYDRFSSENHAKFLKFLDKHFTKTS